MADVAPPAGAAPGRKAVLVAVLVILAVTCLARIPTARVPLDQDCAVYTYVAQRWAAGELPYRDAWDHKPPLVFFLYRTLFAVTSPSGAGVNGTLRVASALVDAATAVLLFFLASRLLGYWQGVAAGLLCGLFTALPGIQYEALQPERVVVLCLTGGFLAAVVYADKRCYWSAALSGLLFGLALVMKPIAAPAGVVVWAWLTWDAWREERGKAVKRIVVHSVLLAVGAVLPWLLFMGYFAAKGAFGEFWFCTYTYNARYAADARRGGLVESARLLVKTKMYEHCLWWALAGAGVAIALVRQKLRRGGLLALGWLLAAFLGVFLPGQFAYYYYVPTGAPLALAGSAALVALVAFARSRRSLRLRVVVAGAGCAVLVGCLGLCWLRQKGHLQRQADPKDTNAVVVEIAKHLRQHTEPGDRLYVWGSRPQLYILSERVGACPYLYNFRYKTDFEDALFFQDEHRKRIVAGLEQHKPPFIVATETESLEGFPELRAYLAEQYEFERDWVGKPYSPKLYRRKDAP